MTPSKCRTCGHSPPQKIIRRMDTPESRAFWKGVKETAAQVRTWPAWQRSFYKKDEKCQDCGHFLGFTTPSLGIT